MRSLVIIVLSFFLAASAFAQDSQPLGPIHVTGLILTGDSLRPVPYAYIREKHGRFSNIGDFKGMFSIYAETSDTIMVSSIGFKKSSFIIPDTINSGSYVKFLMLFPDTTCLKEVTIRAWPSVQSFRQDFIQQTIPEDYFALAMKNLLQSELKEPSQVIPADGKLNYKYFMEPILSRNYYSGQIQPYTVFDIVRWKQFFDAWMEGRIDFGK